MLGYISVGDGSKVTTGIPCKAAPTHSHIRRRAHSGLNRESLLKDGEEPTFCLEEEYDGFDCGGEVSV
jgi:hypothetical protein